MNAGEPSRTAFAAARHRAAHQILEGGAIFADPLAVTIAGGDREEIVREAQANPMSAFMRRFVCTRARFAEDILAAQVARGTDQCVVLGAGLDTFAYRSPYGEKLRAFEVDHPATGAWKASKLREAGIDPPPWLQTVAVNFETDDLTERLYATGFDRHRATMFIWLGVVPYLTRPAIFKTLSQIAAQPAEVAVVFDYANPPELFSPQMRALHDVRAAQVAAIGEPWITHFTAAELHAELLKLGFLSLEDLGPRQMAQRYYPQYVALAGEYGGHVICARKLT